jgi:hypothetical protein
LKHNGQGRQGKSTERVLLLCSTVDKSQKIVAAITDHGFEELSHLTLETTTDYFLF